jgi:autotransporter-associated beta strand protein
LKQQVFHLIRSALLSSAHNVTATTTASAFTINANSANVSIGTYNNFNNGKDSTLTLGGTTTGNTITTINDTSVGATQFALVKTGAGTWSIGTGLVRNKVDINGGTLKVTGTLTVGYTTGRNLTITGGQLDYNSASAVTFGASNTNGAIIFNGGNLDNSSGAAINTSSTNPRMTWNSNFTFIGSNGADSDLNLGTGAVANATTSIVSVANAATTLTVGGVISGAGGLTKAGAGALTLSGNNSYTGNTTVSAGTLTLSGANTGTGTTMVSGGQILMTNALALQNSAYNTTGSNGTTIGLDVSSGLNSGTLTLGGLSGNVNLASAITAGYTGSVTGLTLNPSAGFSNTYGGVISNGSGATTLTKSGGGTQVLSGPNTYTGITNINAGTLQVGVAENADVSGPLGKQLANAAGTIVFGGGTLQYSAANQFDYSGRFSTAAGQAIRVHTNGQTVTWATDLTSSGGSVTNTGPGTLTLSGNNTFGTLANSGSGTLVLTGTNTYTGATTISAGTLDLGGGTGTGSLSTTALNLAGGTFSYTRNTGSTQAFATTNVQAGASTVTAEAGNTITLGTLTPAAGGSVNFGTTGTITTSTGNNANGILGGWATFGGTNWAVANGAGSAITGFAGTYSFTNDVAIQNSGAAYAGKMISVNSTQTPDAVITPDTLTFNTAGAYTLNLTGANNTISGIMVNSVVGNNASIITGGTSLRGASNGSLSVIQNNLDGALTIGTAIINNGTSGLSKSGAGTVILTANAAYTGTTAIGAGTLQLGNGGATGTLSSSSPIVNNGSLVINHTSTQTLAAISGTGSVTMSGTNTLTLNSGNTYSGGFTLNSGTIAAFSTGTYNGFGSGPLTLNGSAASGMFLPTAAPAIIPNNINWNGTLSVHRSGSSGVGLVAFSGDVTLGASPVLTVGSTTMDINATFTGKIQDGTGSSITFQTGANANRLMTVTLNGVNTYTGDTIFSNAGKPTFVIGGSGSLASGNYSGNIAFNGGAGTFIYSSSANQTLSGIIGGGSGTLTKDTSNTSTLTLSGTNSYTGGTRLNAGTLQFAKKVSQPASGAVAVRDGTTLAVNLGGGAAEWTTGTSGNGTIGGLLAGLGGQSGGTVTYTGNVTLGFDTTNAGSAQTYSGVIGNVGTTLGIKKLGTGTLILDQANTYSGGTTVSAGTLLVNNTTGSGTGSSSVTVGTSGTLGGSGTISGAVTMDGALKPGNSTGLLTLGSLDLNASSSTTLEINGTNRGAVTDGYDALGLNLGGSIDLAGALIFEFGNLAAFAANTEFDLFSFNTTSTGDFTSVTSTGFYAGTWGKEGDVWSLTDEGQTLNFSEVTGNLTVIPEPGAALLGSLGVLMLLRRRRA